MLRQRLNPSKTLSIRSPSRMMMMPSLRKSKNYLRNLAATSSQLRKVKSFEDTLADIVGTFRKLIDSPTSLIMILIVAAVVVTHADDMSSGWLKEMSDKYPSNKVLTFIKDHFKQFLGVAIHACVLLDLPRSVNRSFAWIATIAAVYILPPYNVYQYGVQALLMHAYFRVNLTRSRTVLIMIAFLILFFGHNWLGTLEHPTIDHHTTTHKPMRRSNVSPSGNSER